MQARKLWVCVLVIVGFLVLVFYRNISTNNRITYFASYVEPEDRKVLGSLFEQLISNSTCGYTLFGNKPISFIGFSTRFSQSDFWFQDKVKLLINVGLPVLNKYKEKIDNGNFVIHDEQAGEERIICLINKKAVLDAVRPRIKIFQHYLGSEISPEYVLDLITNEKNNIFNVLNENSALLGILFGYGCHNAVMFHQREIIQNTISTLRIPPWKCSIPGNVGAKINSNVLGGRLRVSFDPPLQIESSSGFCSLEEELAFLNERLEPSKFPNENFSSISPFGFYCDNQDPETDVLLVRCEEVRQKLATMMASKVVFEEVWAKLCKS